MKLDSYEIHLLINEVENMIHLHHGEEEKAVCEKFLQTLKDTLKNTENEL